MGLPSDVSRTRSGVRMDDITVVLSAMTSWSQHTVAARASSERFNLILVLVARRGVIAEMILYESCFCLTMD